MEQPKRKLKIKDEEEVIMGLASLAFGLLILFIQLVVWAVGAILLAYGLFRLYQGIEIVKVEGGKYAPK